MPRRIEGVLAPPRQLGAGVLAVDIRLGEHPGEVRAGQYLFLHHPDGSALAFSIASPPRTLPDLTLHYRSTTGSDDARRMDELLARPGPVTVDLAYGDCGIDADRVAPLVIIAGGTGIAQARSIALELEGRAEAELLLYWGVRTSAELYAREEFDALAAGGSRFRWVAALEQTGGEVAEGFRSGTAAAVVAEDVAAGRFDLRAVELLLCGGPAMVWGTVAALRPHGLTRAGARSDVFSYAPCEHAWDD